MCLPLNITYCIQPFTDPDEFHSSTWRDDMAITKNVNLRRSDFLENDSLIETTALHLRKKAQQIVN